MPPRTTPTDEPTRDPASVSAGFLIMLCRKREELTQAELARRLGISQPAVAQLERPSSNPRIETLERALRAAGAQLVIEARFPPDTPGGRPTSLSVPSEGEFEDRDAGRSRRGAKRRRS